MHAHECQWVSVDDGTGRRRMEMRWVRPGTVTTLTVAPSPAAAARAA